MSAPYDVVALGTQFTRKGFPVPIGEWGDEIALQPFRLLFDPAAYTRECVDLHLRNGQRVTAKRIDWRTPDRAAALAHDRIRVCFRDGSRGSVRPRDLLWGECGGATVVGWRPLC